MQSESEGMSSRGSPLSALPRSASHPPLLRVITNGKLIKNLSISRNFAAEKDYMQNARNKLQETIVSTREE